MSDKNKCLVIGAAGGIGKSLVKSLAEAGWGLVIAGRRKEPLYALAAELGDTVQQVSTLDARRFEDVRTLLAGIDGLSAVVNLPGSILIKPAHSTTEQELRETLEQNIHTAFAVVSAAGAVMRKSGGSVVLMSSCAAQAGLPNHEAISAAKAGVEGLVRSASATYASSALRFNAVAPGLVDTPLASRITGHEASLKASIAMHPLGRIGQPDDIARMIMFLLDPINDWMTGQVIGVDGGLAHLRGR